MQSGFEAPMGATKNAYRILVQKLLTDQPLRSLKRREDNINMGVRETSYEDVRRTVMP
jgi:hypothetical protein